MLFNRLRNSPMVFAVSMIVILPMAVMGYLLLVEIENHIGGLTSERLGLRYITHIRPLIQHIPQHRGMSVAYLHGEASFRQTILEKQSVIDEMFARLVIINKELGGELQTGSRVRDLINEWGVLKPRLFELTPQESFAVQTQMVAEINDLISHVANASGLVLDSRRDSYYMVELLVQQMPGLVEAMGQARAIGSAAAVKGELSEQARGQLLIRLGQIRMSDAQIDGHLQYIYRDDPALKALLEGRGQTVSASVMAFSNLMHDKLLGVDGISASTDEIFSSSTRAIDAVFDTYDTIVPALDNIFAGNVRYANRVRWIGLALIMATLFLVYLATSALFRVLNRFKTTLDVTRDGIFIFRPDDLKFSYANHCAMAQVGYSRDELMQMTPLDIKPEFDAPRFQQLIEPLKSGGENSTVFEAVHQHKDGHLIPVEISLQYVNPPGEPDRFVAVARNIEERKAMQEQIRIRTEDLLESQKRFSFAVEGAGDGVWDWDMENDALEFSPRYLEMLGFAANEKPRHVDTWFNSVQADDLPRVQEALQDYLQGRADRFEVEQRMACKDGGYRWILCRGTAVERDEQGRPSRMIGIHSDITERKEMEQKLIAARNEAEKANRAKSEFLSSMSHELRTPMNAILGFGQLLQTDDSLNEEQKDFVNDIVKGGKHLLELINEVLDLAKIESGRIDLSLEPVGVCVVVKECLELVGPLAEARHVQLGFGGQKGLAVRADRTRFRQILLNLLSNAIKYNRDNGEVKIEAQPDGNDWVVVRVADTGPGIAAERLQELFQPFNRLGAENGDIEGTGIGLTITRRIIEMMGGSMGVESEVGVGSAFWIKLPYEQVDERDDCRKWVDDNGARPGIGVGLARHTVLYIEDNPANLKLVTQLLGRHKHIRLLTAHTPALGIDLAQTHHPELILLDINMPGMNGYQVMEVLKEHDSTKTIPVVAITANAMPSDVRRGREAGFTDYLIKPLDMERFHAVIGKLLGEM